MGPVRPNPVQAPPAAVAPDHRRSSGTFILITVLILSPASSYYHNSRSAAYLESRAAVNRPGHLRQRNNTREGTGRIISSRRSTKIYFTQVKVAM